MVTFSAMSREVIFEVVLIESGYPAGNRLNNDFVHNRLPGLWLRRYRASKHRQRQKNESENELPFTLYPGLGG